mmetsp:Transcript_5930/g.7471  ORF Transcript_5930/g.7471 Transcript_5930/m.7471 type:complete len:85 (-) Transcript_5930:524-778(-)
MITFTATATGRILDTIAYAKNDSYFVNKWLSEVVRFAQVYLPLLVLPRLCLQLFHKHLPRHLLSLHLGPDFFLVLRRVCLTAYL